MNSKRDVQARVWDYLRDRGMSVSELARRAEIPGATLARMLRDDPTYKGTRDAWAALARYVPLRLSEPEVLAAVGLGPPVLTDHEEDPWVLLERAMQLLQLSERYRSHLRFQAEVLSRASQAESTAEP